MDKDKFKDLIEAPKKHEKEFWNRIAIGALGVAFHSEATYQDAYSIADSNMQKHGANNYYIWDRETYWNVVVKLKN